MLFEIKKVISIYISAQTGYGNGTDKEPSRGQAIACKTEAKKSPAGILECHGFPKILTDSCFGLNICHDDDIM